VGALELEDIQGVVLRQYLMPTLRHFLLKVRNPAAARALLGRLVSGDEDDAPQISTAAEPASAAAYRLHLGITWPGLVALGVRDLVPGLSFKSFPAFQAGAAARAAMLGDVGPSAPEHWVGGFGSGDDHVLVTLYTDDRQVREEYSARLDALFSVGCAFEELWRMDGEALTELRNGSAQYVGKVHFGYVDGISQPTIIGGPEAPLADHQQPCVPWLFVLLDEALSYYVPDPPELGRNGSFVAFRVSRQDVVGFEEFLQSHRDVIDPELLAAKICGRWRNGVPLALSPETDSPPEGIAPERLNDFEYVNPDGSGDPSGLRTPIGAHVRRVNPRGQPIKGQGRPGGSNNDHRMVRRGLPYGPPYVPGEPYDGIERGLLGYFINASIDNQFEFVVREWLNDNEFVGSTRLDPHARGVLTGTNNPPDSVFEAPQPSGPPLRITGFGSFVTTRATAYCFLPSLTAMRFIARLGS
jgi:deferrochelatase/peroxidase EfeB